MGNFSCISCINDLAIKASGGNHLEIVSKPSYFSEMYTECDSQIISIQTCWRGYSKRRHYQFLKKLRLSSSFFPRVDLFETLFDRILPTDLETRKYEYLSGAIYEGEWLGGFRHGKGQCNWPDGSSYSGSWSYGYPSGIGTFNHISKNSFQGKWISPYSTSKNSSIKKDGFVWLSTQTQLNQSKSKSSLKQIEHLYLSLNSLNTKFSNLQESFISLHVAGEVFERSGIMHQGEICEGERDGFGITKWGNGDLFTGHWKNNLKHGVGKEEWVDGSTFLGTYVKGCKEGLGEYKWEDGSSYKGEWAKNQCDGLGVYVWSDGRKYEGYWKDGLMHGFGIFRWSNGVVYEGEWAYGKKHGLGITKNQDGTETRDFWEFGKVKRLV